MAKHKKAHRARTASPSSPLTTTDVPAAAPASPAPASVAIAASAAETEPAPPLARGSVVDIVFDRLTDIATKGLSVAKRGLEASARWLDAQAKRAGDLAAKIDAKAVTDATAE